ncbi:M20 family metallopeptidase [Paratractidigestivibacter sp.]|uniref:M20 family metallopeptidase n=1 Tax=Paratractidigestivibacter sp. TaxID=2847316 RepID=UPI002AC97D55|nr:M20 family metallopeptidase [Paratractidigestivibacter sp.]
MDFYQRARELKDETVANRRHIHTNAEVGLELPKTVAFVMEKLTEYGLEPRECGHGVTCTLGSGEPVIMLRADMDALPMPEESGEPFACPDGKTAHACGHDFHASMLLTAARMLKENEAELKGTVKFMFQPAEETFEGAKDMICAGILEDPKPDVALAYHVAAGKMPVGIYMYNDKSTMMYSVDGFKIVVHGKGSHGAYPQNSIDPINVAVHIYQALEAIIAREVDATKAAIMTIGHFEAGAAANIIPDTAMLEGTIRSNDKGAREVVVRRMHEVAEKTAEAFGATAEVITLSDVAPLICDGELTREVVGYMQELSIPGAMPYPGIEASASEDFATIAEKIPSTFMYLSAGYPDERGAYGAHNPKVQFNEDVCEQGPAYLAHCAVRWLESHQA